MENQNNIKKFCQELRGFKPVHDLKITRKLFDCLQISKSQTREEAYVLFLEWMQKAYMQMAYGVTNRNILILVGPQGTYKTSFLNNLCPLQLKEYSYCTHIPLSPHYEYTISLLTETAFVNIDDQLSVIIGRDMRTMMDIRSRSIFVTRKTYREASTEVQRIANIMASCNSLPDSLLNEKELSIIHINSISREYASINMYSVWIEIANSIN